MNETACELAFECGDEYRYDINMRKSVNHMLGGEARVVIAQTCIEVAKVLEGRAEQDPAFWEQIDWFDNLPIIGHHILSALASDICAATHVMEWVDDRLH